ncbi:MAG: DedA family protein, partial [Alphaproteobacteria bacterium HGW-Alphaproteobacteria-16]
MTELLLGLLDKGGYLGIFVLMILENVFPPIPSEVILGAAGVLVEQGKMNGITLWIIATAGTLAGNLFWYWLGSRWS